MQNGKYFPFSILNFPFPEGGMVKNMFLGKDAITLGAV